MTHIEVGYLGGDSAVPMIEEQPRVFQCIEPAIIWMGDEARC